MSPELQAELRAAYPLMFGKKGSVVDEYGIEISDGWYTLLSTVCELVSLPYRISAEAHKANPTQARRCALEVEARMLPQLSQVKQKFGKLRVHLSRSNPRVATIVQFAEVHSQRVCEVCGAPGFLRGPAWLRTRCDDHQDSEEP